MDGPLVPFRQFVLKVHSRCDLACDHCYVYEHADQSWRTRPKAMPHEIVVRTARRIAAIAADVEQGNSGGPLLTPSGRVIGLVFAKSTSRSDLGYAMTPDEFGSVVDRASSLTTAVSTGACSRG